MSIGSLTYEQSVFKHCRSDKHLSQFYLQDGGKNSLGVDMERNYVTDTLCIPVCDGQTQPVRRHRVIPRSVARVKTLSGQLNRRVLSICY